ncbi:hypothetical protein BH09MYX1_BH09MYX1_50600 [soil metagenome]
MSASPDDEPAFEENVAVRRRNPWMLALGASPLVASLVLVLGGLIMDREIFGVIPVVTILGIVTLLWTLRQNPLPISTVDRVVVSRSVLHVGDDAIPMGEVKSAVIVPGGFPKVLIGRRGPNLGPIELLTQSTAKARQLLRAIGFDASQRTFTIASASWLRATWPRSVLTILGALGAIFVGLPLGQMIHVPAFVVLATVLVPVIVGASLPTKVNVGSDGIFIEWLRWKRFIPLDAIATALVYSDDTGGSRRDQVRVGVTIKLHHGEHVTLPMGRSWDLARAQALVERIEEVRADARIRAHGDATSPMAVEAALARIERTGAATTDWLRMLRALGAGAIATHRVAPVASETLLRVVEDATNKPADRAAAAIALASSGEHGMRDRIRIATETVVDPKLRIALEHVLDDDEAALEAAVDSLTEGR